MHKQSSLRRTRTLRALVPVLAASASVAVAAVVKAAELPAVEVLDARIRSLAGEAQRLEDIAAVGKLQRAYAYYLDKGYWDEAADLFAEDATMEVGVDGVYVGKARIRERIRTEGGGWPGPGLKYGQLNTRLQLQPVIAVAADGRLARARWRELALMGQYHQHAEWGTGLYENEYVKQDGVWKIGRLHYYPSFVAPYEGGWARLRSSEGDWTSATGKALPADHAPTIRYRPFPDSFTPQFHYLPSDVGAARFDLGLTPAPDVSTQQPVHAMAGGSPSNQELKLLAAEADHAQHDLALLASRVAIENLQGAYGYYIDKGLWDEASSLFATQGSYEFGQQGVYVGRAHVRKALALMAPTGLKTGQLNDYPMLQPIIDVSPDNRTAKARWRSDVMLAVDGKGEWGGGVYENEYVNEHGTWKISRLHFYVTFLSDYDGGWIQSPIPMQGPSQASPPDRPPSEVYASLPGVYLVPYHYRNPVAAAEPSVEPHVSGAGLTPELAALEQRTNALAHQVELLKDRVQIEKIQRAYGYYVDKAQWPEIAALFSEQGTYEIGGRGVFVGPKRVLEYLVTGLGPIGIAAHPGQLLDHQQFQGIVDVAADGTTARGRWVAFVMGGGPGGTPVWGDCIYENSYVKENGVWKARSFRAPFTMYASYKGGWKDTSVPNTRPDSFPPPPDLPPSVVYLTYPSFYVTPFHYPNPVTGRQAPPPNPAAGGTPP